MTSFANFGWPRRTLTGALALSIPLIVMTGCSNSTDAPSTTISAGQVPAPGSQDGIHSVADTDYEQIALAVDTTQIELATLALDPSRQADTKVRSIAKTAADTVGPEATVLRAKLVNEGNATTTDHHQPAVTNEQVNELKELSGERFDSAWARAMMSLNEQVIQAATTELNTGEDRETRAMARTKIDYAAAQNGALKPIAAKQ